jgi:hypothetical protein
MIASWSVYMLVAILPAPFRCLWFLDARHWRRLGGLETGAKALACVYSTLLAASSGAATSDKNSCKLELVCLRFVQYNQRSSIVGFDSIQSYFSIG